MESSKVRVEYNDSGNAFRHVEQAVRAQLPLRNLHWNSATRPLRSVDSLHIDLVPEPPVHPKDGSSDQARTSTSGDGIPKKERRHQIPGLRQTPYLRLCFFQCEDVDSYKTSSRANLREWVTKASSVSQHAAPLSRQEYHDASEWLLVYVEVENLESQGPSDRKEKESQKKSSTSKWKSRGSKTVIDKVRSDFGAQSKGAQDRIIQLVVERPNEATSDTVPAPPRNVTGVDELVTKMKQYILASFDLRVQQYEEDIREKEEQRSLPGWNFNTFFVLKEGLARGFESVGLIEDALTGYDELALRLESIVTEQLSKEESEPQIVHFDVCTDDLQRVLSQSFRDCMRLEHDREQYRAKVADLGSWLLDVDRKPFRSLILENNISIFDFECYIFARRISLLLRKANSQVTLAESDDDANKPKNRKDTEDTYDAKDHVVLAQICQVSLDFIGAASSIIRRDLEVSCTQSLQQMQTEDTHLSALQVNQIMDNIVNSWIVSACEVILSVTNTASMSREVDASLRRLRRSTHLATLSDHDIMSPISPNITEKIFPRRTSSLSFRSPSFDALPRGGPSANSLQNTDANRALPGAMKAGLIDLASKRGNLLSLAKRTLGSTGRDLKRWSVGLQQGRASSRLSVGFEDIYFSQTSTEAPRDCSEGLEATHCGQSAGVLNDTIRAALVTKEQFTAVYEHIVALASAHYSIAGCSRMVDESNADLAVIYCDLCDYEVAVDHFKQLSAIYNDKEWLILSVSMLDLWARCLRELQDIREAISTGLRALALACSSGSSVVAPSWSLTDLLQSSQSLDEPLRVNLEHYFANIRLGRTIEHDASQDGFQIKLYLQSLVSDTIEADQFRLQLRNVEGHYPSTFWIERSGKITINPGSNEIELSSTVLTSGWYVLAKIQLVAGQIEFHYEAARDKDVLDLPDMPAKSNASLTQTNVQQPILIWEETQGLSVELAQPLNVDLARSRILSLRISSGKNDISKGLVHLRPASAGLRLYQAEAEVSRPTAAHHIAPGQHDGIAFGTMSAGATMVMAIPYSLETERKEITINNEADYDTATGHFKHMSTHKIALNLAVAVTVQETFTTGGILSKFTVGPATSCPIQVLGAEIKGNDHFVANLYGWNETEWHGFQCHPVSLLARIECLSVDLKPLDREEVRQRLHLQLRYQSLDQLVLQSLQNGVVTQLPEDLGNKYSALLCGHIRDCVGAQKDPKELELCAMLGKVRPRSYKNYGWERILKALEKKDASILRELLMEWHQCEHPIPCTSAEQSALTRQLRVPVDLPEIQVLHRVELTLSAKQHDVLGTLLVGQGQVVAANISIQHTRQWSRSRTTPPVLAFCYDLHAELDSWLIGGQRSASFQAKDGETLSFSIFLLPQKLGHLPLPKIHISAIEDDKAETGATEAGRISCEVTYVNQADTVYVMPHTPEMVVRLAGENESGSIVDPPG